LGLNRIAEQFGIRRSKAALEALRLYEEQQKLKFSASAKILGDAELSRKFREMRSKASSDWWKKLTPEEKTERARKANKARWKGKKK
jgi:hypothetical protein